MPKRGKKPKGDPSLFPYEGRPSSGLTLGNFFSDEVLKKTCSGTSEEYKGASQPTLTTQATNEALERGNPSTSGVNETEEFFIKKTKKGKIPISLENRAKGKKVTVIGNVSGNAGALLTLLKKRTGAGGVVRTDNVEIQGDHQIRITEFLTGHPCLRA